MPSVAQLNRMDLLRRGRRLQWFTIGWNSLEGLVSITAGAMSGSISLMGFGIDSLIEVTSGVAALWRVHAELELDRRERIERLSLRIVGLCFMGLALYLLIDSGLTLWHQERPEHSPFGIVITALSLIVMPVLASAKRAVGRAMGSATIQADARQTDFCMYLSVIALAGLVLNWWCGWWWADPAGALLMVPIIAREGVEALRGEECSCHGGAST
jgi:divalent metal cation (Fe/Co/Zn/Cd) transporter